MENLIGKEQCKSFAALFNEIYKGDRAATDLSFTLLRIAHTWDDLIDGAEVSNRRIDDAFIAATFTLSTNPLWGEDLAFNLLNVYLRWSDANKIECNEKSTENDLSMAWMLRAGMYDLFVLIAVKLHGLEWGASIGVMVRLHYGETLHQYLEEMNHA